MEVFASDLAKAVAQQPQPQPQVPAPPRRLSSLDVAGEARMEEALGRMIDADDKEQEQQERLHGGADRWRRGEQAEGGLLFLTPTVGTPGMDENEEGESGSEGLGGLGAYDVEGEGKEQLQSLIVRLMLHSAGSGGAPLEPELEGDLRTLVGSSLFDEIFSADPQRQQQHQQRPRRRGPAGGAPYQHMRRGGSNTDVLFAPAALRRLSGGLEDDDEEDEDDEEGYDDDGVGLALSPNAQAVVAGLAALRVPEEAEGEEGDEEGDFFSKRAREKEARQRAAAEEDVVDDIRLQPNVLPPPPRPASVEAVGGEGEGVGGEGGEGVVVDEWEDDADPGYVAMVISETEFFDMVRGAWGGREGVVGVLRRMS